MSASAAKNTSEQKTQPQAVQFAAEPAVLTGVPEWYGGILGMQRKIGNRAMGQIIQTKLTVSTPGDRHEQEADRVAEEVLRIPTLGTVPTARSGPLVAGTMQRTCSSCEDEEKTIRRKILPWKTPIVSTFLQPGFSSGAATNVNQRAGESQIHRKCNSCEEEERKTIRPKASPGQSPAVAPNLESQLDGLRGAGGQPLPENVRAFFEPRFGVDFSHVRIHNNAQATDVASSVSARAFTLGHDIVFGAGQYAPRTPGGEKLLAHELTHVLQQQPNRAPARVGNPSPDIAAAQYTHSADRIGRSTILHSATPTLQRAPDEKAPEPTLAWWETALLDSATGPALVMGTGVRDLIRAVLLGLVLEVKGQIKAGKGGEFYDRIKGLLKSPTEFFKFYTHYLWGLIKGIFSPITGLFDLAKLAVKLGELQFHILQTVWTKREELAKDAAELIGNFNSFKQKATAALKGLADNPGSTVKALSTWIDSQKEKVRQKAQEAGHSIGKSIFESLEKPWSEIGETVGEVIGTVIINVVLFIFTEGIGNAIVQIASKLGELGSWLGKLGKGAKLLAWVVEHIGTLLGTVGGLIADFERAIASVAEVLLKPLKPVMDEFGRLMGSLRSFLRRLLGVSDEAATAGAEKLAAGAGKTLEPHVSGGPKSLLRPLHLHRNRKPNPKLRIHTPLRQRMSRRQLPQARKHLRI